MKAKWFSHVPTFASTFFHQPLVWTSFSSCSKTSRLHHLLLVLPWFILWNIPRPSCLWPSPLLHRERSSQHCCQLREPNLFFIFFILPNISSQGATAVLIYGAIDVPLAQPRSLFGGHFLGALVGICITKLFHLLPTEERFESLLWLAGSLSCSVSIVVMQITGTMHPPAGKLYV